MSISPALHADAVARLTLDEAIALGLEHNRALAQSARGTDIAGTDLAAARARYALALTPSVAAGAGPEAEDVTEYGLSAAKLFASGATVSVDARRSETNLGATRFVTVSLEQPLFRRFGRLPTDEPVVAANSRLARAERALFDERAALIVSLVAAYAEAQRLAEQVRFDQQAVARSELHHRLARAQEGAGRVRRVDVLRADLRRGEAEQRLAADRERLEVARLSLEELIGVPLAPALELAAPVAPDYRVADGEALGIALANRLDYAQALADAQDATRGAELARRELLPDLVLTASWRHEPDPLPSTDPAFAPPQGLFLGLRGSFDANPAGRRHRVRGAELGALAAADGVVVAERAIARQVLQALHAHRQALAEAEIAARNLTLAEAQMTLARRMFAAGRLDSFSVTDAETSFAVAQAQRLAADGARVIRGFELARATGTLVEAPAKLRPDKRGAT